MTDVRNARLSTRVLVQQNLTATPTRVQNARLMSRVLVSLVVPEPVAAKVWNGTAFVDAAVKVWDGSTFVDVAGVKTWNGSAFV